ncbi:hypothetical protein ACHAWF_005539 [Thalassiosira exigua]
MDIEFGDCVSVGDTRYVLILVDRACRYSWLFRLKSLSYEDIIGALKSFRAEAGRLVTLFRYDCDEKLFGNAIRSFLHDGNSHVEAAPSGQQSANGLVESHWKTMAHMSRANLTKKQMPRKYWFPAIKHVARMMNMIPGKFRDRLASPFMLVHGVRPDQWMWTPTFSVCYFHHKKDGGDTRTHTQAHTLDGVIVGWPPTSNAVFISTTLGPNNTTDLTPIASSPTACLRPCTPPSRTTVVSSVHRSKTTTRRWRSRIPRAPAWRRWIPPRACSVRVPSWTFPWIPRSPPITLLRLTTAPPAWSWLYTWRPSSQSCLSLMRRTRSPLLCLRSSATTPASPTSTTASITRGSVAKLEGVTVNKEREDWSVPAFEPPPKLD